MRILCLSLAAIILSGQFTLAQTTRPIDEPNYIVGAIAIDGSYHFTNETPLVEAAQVLQGMGANVIKLALIPVYARRDVPKEMPGVDTLVKLARDEPSHRRVLDMPFKNFVMWAHPFADIHHEWDGEITPEHTAADYREMYDLTTYLLTTYNGTGKTFYLGHWEGDGWLRHSVAKENDVRVTPERVARMIDWQKTRQRAVEDARRDTPHHDVAVWNYMEVNHVMLAMDQDRPAMVNKVLPNVPVDFVSYSSYDATNSIDKHPDSLKRAMDYIESKLVPKPEITGKRVWVGEYGYPARRKGADVQERLSRLTMQEGLKWGSPFILYWELYNNEITKDGQQDGFWLIDDKNQKQPAYALHETVLKGLHEFANTYHDQHGSWPTDELVRAKALELLK